MLLEFFRPGSIPRTQWRMLATLGLVLFVAFLITSAISYGVSRQSIRHSILEGELPLSSDNIYSEIQRDLFKPILISSLMANDTFVKDWIKAGERDEAAIMRYLRHIQQKYGTITSFLASEATRKYYHSAGVLKVVREDNPVDAWFFRVRQMTEDYEINVDPDLANQNTMTIFINYRILDSQGKFLGATGVGLTVNAVKALMQDYRTRYNRDIYFYNKKGALVMHSFAELTPAQMHDAAERGEEALDAMAGQLREGVPHAAVSAVRRNGTLVNIRYIPELNWILVVEQATDRTRPVLFQSLGLNLLICLGTSLVLLACIRVMILRYQRNLESRNVELQERNAWIEEQAHALSLANEKLDAMAKEKDHFIGVVVHELKNPLNAVLGLSRLLLEDRSVSAPVKEELGYIHATANIMQEEVESLLQLTELEGLAAIPLENVDAGIAAREVVAGFRFAMQSKQISSVVDIPAAPVIVRAHRKWLHAAMANLVSNAVKYSRTGGTISVTVAEKNGRVEFAVRDSGEGLGPGEIGQLFQKFRRLGPRPTGGESSSGLGLYLVREMLEKMNGSVRCESEKGKGCRFILSLPGG